MFAQELYLRAKFKPNNRIKYSQDHMTIWGDNVPPHIWFRVKHLAENIFVLTACGYGCLERHCVKCYGNGSLYVRFLKMKEEIFVDSQHGAGLPHGPYKFNAGVDKAAQAKASEVQLVEPSDGERSNWPQTTEQYVAELEAIIDKQAEQLDYQAAVLRTAQKENAEQAKEIRRKDVAIESALECPLMRNKQLCTSCIYNLEQALKG